jgi:hypothetical protein
MNTKSPECWASEPQARGLRIEISAEYSLLLPHDEFLYAELKSDSPEQRLRLVFATHEISIRGNSLRRIETAMQRMDLSFLATLPRSQRSLIPDGQPVILGIVVTEVKEVERQPATTAG